MQLSIKFYKYLDRALSKLPGREVLLFPGSWGLDLMNIVERERRAPGGSRGPVTLPSRGRVHRSPGLRSSPFSLLKILTSLKLQQIGGRASSSVQLGIKFYKYLDRALSKLPGKRYCSSGQLRSLDLMNIVERERRAPGGSGTGDPTLPGRVPSPQCSRALEYL